MTTRFSPHRSPLVAVLLLGGCSPDLSLLDEPSFADAGTSGQAAASAGSESGGVSGNGAGGGPAGAGGSSADGTAAGGAAGDTSGGGGVSSNVLPAEGGAGGEPSPTPCVATGAEKCNGADDDCNGVVDDGCPGGISTTFVKDLAALGDSTGGGPFTDDCKDGEVLGGVGVTMGAFLSQIHGVCRTLSLELSANAVHGYRVKLTGERALSGHPATSMDMAVDLACPEDEALVGLRLGQQNAYSGDTAVPVITRIWLTCAKLVLVEHNGKLGISWEGPRELAPASGSFANGTAWLVSSLAPDGLVASRLLGASGSWVDRVGFGLSRLDLVFQ